MLKNFSIKAKISIVLSSLIMLSFFVVQTLLMFKVLDSAYPLSAFGFMCIVAFVPLFLIIVGDINRNQKTERIKKRTLEGIINDSSLVSRADSKGKITYVNDLFCEVSGYKRHELLGKDHNILNSGKHSREFWNQMYLSTVKHKTIWNETVTNKAKDGSEYIVDSWITAEFDEKGKHTGYFSTTHDLTNLHKTLNEIKDKESELSAIMNGIDESSATIEYSLFC